ncbi:MAG: hypothetical protein FWG99_06415 [Treponema sp.]|nr:hypothetical protein [Treponema sp.]
MQTAPHIAILPHDRFTGNAISLLAAHHRQRRIAPADHRVEVPDGVAIGIGNTKANIIYPEIRHHKFIGIFDTKNAFSYILGMVIKSSKYLVFADEAGDTHLDKYPAEFPMFLLAFVIIEKSEYCRNLLPRFAELKLRYFPDVNTIFHERDIRHKDLQYCLNEKAAAFRRPPDGLPSHLYIKYILYAIKKQANFANF